MLEGDLALMIPIVAIVAWSPIGKAIAASIHAVADEIQAKADRIRRPNLWDSLGQRIRGDAHEPLPGSLPNEDLAARIKALEDEIQHLREAAVMAPFPARSAAVGSEPLDSAPVEGRTRGLRAQSQR